MFERFTSQARHVVVLAQEEARRLRHNNIDTEHILLGLVREGTGTGGGTGAQVLRQHSADLMPIRMAVLDLAPAAPAEPGRGRRWLRRRSTGALGEAGESELRITPAADTSLSEAARLAGSQPVGSHHLLLAALGDPDTAAARALAALGVDLDQASDALRNADVA